MINRWKRRSDKKKQQQRLDRSITRDRIWPICSADITANYACRLALHLHPHPQTCFMTHLCRFKDVDVRGWKEECVMGVNRSEKRVGALERLDSFVRRKKIKGERKECCCFREFKGWRWLFFLFPHVLSQVCVCARERGPLCGGNLFFLLRIILHELTKTA